MNISVAMCVFNGARFLKEQLDSINAQSIKPFEIIICDDRSTDDSVKIIQEFSKITDIDVKLYVNSETLGSTRNFEKALKLCAGEILVLSDQDDVWIPSKLELIHEEFIININSLMVFSDALMVDVELRPLGYTLWQALKFTRNQQTTALIGDLISVLLKHNIVTGATMALRRSCLQKVLPLSPLWNHDSWIAVILAFYGHYSLISEPLIYYRQHSQNQIGARKLAFSEMLHRTFQRGRTKYFYNQYCMYLSLYIFLLDSTQKFCLKSLSQKIEHLNNRSVVNEKFSSIIFCIKDFIYFRYYLFSIGFLSFIEDCLVWLSGRILRN